MSSYKSVPTEFTIEEALDTTEISDLRDEMQEWVDNMSGTGLENTNKYQMAEEAVSQLENVDSINFDEIWDELPDDGLISADELMAVKFTSNLYTPKSRKQHPSRAYRLSNAITHITDALQEMRDYIEDKLGAKEMPEEVKSLMSAIGDIESQIQELDNVEFPGMFS